MDRDIELIIPILEILEIEVCNILYKPGNIGKQIVSIQSHPGNSGSYDPYLRAQAPRPPPCLCMVEYVQVPR